MRTLLIGTGAIGGTLAVCAKEKGYDIDVVSRPAAAEAILDDGFCLRGFLGFKKAALPAVGSVKELTGKYDYVLIATKAYDMPDIAREVLPLLNEDSLVVSLQNGICLDALAEIVGKDRTVGCVIGFGATLLSPTLAEVTSGGELIVGKITPKYGEKMTALKELMSAGFPCAVSESIYEELYSKLLVNSCITSLGALCGLTLGEMLKKKVARLAFMNIIREGMAVADKLNIRVPAYGGKLDYYKFLRGPDLKRHIVIRIVGKKYRNLKSSSLQSLERQKPTEIDYFNGYIAKKGRELSVPTPVNDKIIALIREIETGARAIAFDNFDEISYPAKK